MSQSNGVPQNEHGEPAGEQHGPEPTAVAVEGLPGRFDAGDGQGQYVYKRRGPFGRMRARVQALVQLWLETAVPRDTDSPPQPGSVTYVLAGTWKRKLITIVVALMVGILLAGLVLAGL